MNKLFELRAVLQENGLDALIIPSEDCHQSEYVAERDKRREFVSGFTGSAGTVLVTQNHALLWTDGRYFAQASLQLNQDWNLMRMGEAHVPSIGVWLKLNIPAGVVGFDPSVTGIASQRKLALEMAPCSLVATKFNLVDAIWRERPPSSAAPIFMHPIEFAGIARAQKLSDLRFALSANGCSSHIVTALDAICWLLNLRGADIPFNPVFTAYVVVTMDQVFFYVDQSKLSAADIFQLSSEVTFRPYESIFHDLSAPDCGLFHSGNVWIDPETCNFSIYQKIPPHLVFEKQSPITLPKAIKNSSELSGIRQAHIRDAAAVCSFFCWLEREIALKVPHDEVSISEKLYEFRSQQPYFAGLSFETIAGFGPNGAIIHYKAESETAAKIDDSNTLLIDSGAQYFDGTTDITRTVHLGLPTAHQRACFSRVLKGHVRLAMAVFPHGTNGPTLDILARSPLWEVGLDYRHGTGHGVGAFLNVHEGPQGIGSTVRKASLLETAMVPGMVVSNEPGYYEEGNFGIRIESVMICQDADTPFHFNGTRFYCFDTVALVPIQSKLIDLDIINGAELAWINAFHGDLYLNPKCRRLVSPLLNGEALDWLVKNTEPLGANI